MSIAERRCETRFLCAELVRVKWLNQETDAILEDISPYGACVQVEQAIELETPITLTIGRTSFPGRVTYSVFRDYGHFVGMRFAAETCWSAETVIPQHLISLYEIAHGPEPHI